MSIDKITGFMPQVQSIPGLNETQKTQPSQTKGPNFSEMLADAFKEVDTLQKDANNQIEGLVVGREGVTQHGAMIALEKADTAFQLMTQIKSKIIKAYEEVMRTQV